MSPPPASMMDPRCEPLPASTPPGPAAAAAAAAPAGQLDLEAHDAALLARFCATGDRTALETLFAHHQDAAWGLAMRYLGHASDAEDALQSAFLQILAHAHQQRQEGRVRAWILAAVGNACRMHLRAEGRRRRHERAQAAMVAAVSAVVEEPLTRTERTALVQQVVDSLPAPLRTAVWLRYRQGLTIAEAATAMDVPERTMRAQLEQALAELKRRLARAAISEEALLGLLPLLPEQTTPPSGLVAAGARAAAATARRAREAVVGHVLAGALLLALTGGAVVSLVAPTAGRAVERGPRVAPAPLPVAAPTPAATVDALAQPVTLTLRHARLGEALAQLDAVLPPAHRFPYACAAPLAEEPWAGVSLRMAHAPVREVLTALTTAAGASWSQEHGVVLVASPPDPARAALQARWPTLAAPARRAFLEDSGDVVDAAQVALLLTALADADPGVVVTAEQTLQRLEPALPDPPQVSLGAVAAGVAPLAQALRQRLAHAPRDLWAASWCARVGVPGCTPALLGALRTAAGGVIGPEVRLAVELTPTGALHAFINGVDPPRGQLALALVGPAVPEPDARERREALIALADSTRGFSDQEAVLAALGRDGSPPALATLERCLAHPGDHWSAEEMLSALGSSHAPQALAPLAAALTGTGGSETGARARATARATLVAMGTPEALTVLLAAPRQDARDADDVADALLQLPPETSPAALALLARTAADPQRAAMVQPALARWGDADALTALIASCDAATAPAGAAARAPVEAPVPALRVLRALTESHDERATAALLRATAPDRPAALRAAAAGVLPACRDATALARAMALAEDRDPTVVQAALRGLAAAPADPRRDRLLRQRAAAARVEERVDALIALDPRHLGGADRALLEQLLGDADPGVRLRAVAVVVTAASVAPAPTLTALRQQARRVLDHLHGVQPSEQPLIGLADAALAACAAAAAPATP